MCDMDPDWASIISKIEKNILDTGAESNLFGGGEEIKRIRDELIRRIPLGMVHDDHLTAFLKYFLLFKDLHKKDHILLYKKNYY